jgi:CubicO group peptidase (beta-lactamase class C family)
MFHKAITITITMILLTFILAYTGQAITTVRAAPTPTMAAVAASLDAQDVEAFMDGFINAQLSTHHIAGATVAVVKDGQVILVKGYGYADYAALKPVDGQTTLFLVASISKLFVWTSVMQLVEQGKIDLNADVNTYLKTFRIPDAFGKPVTMLNLMTHTAGFEDSNRDASVDTLERLQPLGVFLSGHIPERVYPPGTISAYSNYGAALAGYIVQEVSGMPFEDYVEKNIFTPLGMTRSTSRQPVPDALKADVSNGYYVNSGQFRAGDSALLNVFPAGSLTTTAPDIARFMIAHLQDGEYNGARILEAKTAQEMHSRAWTPSAEIEGMAHGFFATTINGQRVLQHGGDTELFHSELMLIPQQGVGLFVSYNSMTGGSGGSELEAAFMDRYFPVQRVALKSPADFKTRLNSYIGSFDLARRNYSTPEKILGLVQYFTVSPGPDDTLLMTSDRSQGDVDQWVETKPGVFKLAGGDDTLVFLDKSRGQYQTAYIGSLASIGLLRSPWYATPSFDLRLLAICLIMFLTGILAAPVGLFGLRIKPATDERRQWLRRAARWVAFSFCLLTILYVLGSGSLYIALTSKPGGDFAPLMILTQVARVGVLLALAMVALSYFVWRGKYWSLAGRIHYTLLTVAAWAFIGFGLVWRLLG